MPFDGAVHLFGRAACSGDEHAAGHEQPASTSPQNLIMQALRARASIMFSGESGAAVASGIDGDAAVAEKPDYGLARAAIKIVDDLPDALFDPHAEHRPRRTGPRPGGQSCRSGPHHHPVAHPSPGGWAVEYRSRFGGRRQPPSPGLAMRSGRTPLGSCPPPPQPPSDATAAALTSPVGAAAACRSATSARRCSAAALLACARARCCGVTLLPLPSTASSTGGVVV